MKRLAHPEISQLIVFEENRLKTIVIENRNFFRRIVKDLAQQINGDEGEFILSENFIPIDISRNIELITQFVPFELNRKNILTKIQAYAEKEAVNESNFIKTQGLLTHIERFMNELLFSFSYDFEYEKLNIGSIIKSAGIIISENYGNELEKIIDYLQLVREFEWEKIFVFVNIRSYFSDEDIEIFTREAISRKFQILLIDNVESKHISNEQRLVIDADLCEIY